MHYRNSNNKIATGIIIFTLLMITLSLSNSEEIPSKIVRLNEDNYHDFINDVQGRDVLVEFHGWYSGSPVAFAKIVDILVDDSKLVVGRVMCDDYSRDTNKNELFCQRVKQKLLADLSNGNNVIDQETEQRIHGFPLFVKFRHGSLDKPEIIKTDITDYLLNLVKSQNQCNCPSN